MEAPKINEIWQIQWGEAVGKEYNTLVKIIDDKKIFTPKNWRYNVFRCEHNGKEIIVGGDRFVERWLTA